jgi:predicted nucleic acid-binding protein
MKRTYIDTGVLIAAARGKGKMGSRALAILGERSTREFVSSEYVKFELLPKPTYFGHQAELEFYEEFFSTASQIVPLKLAHLRAAYREACKSGLSAFDAVHVVVASLSSCDELITSEGPNSAIHRTQLVQTTSIDL